MFKIHDEGLREEVDREGLIQLSSTDFFKRKLDAITLESINGMPTGAREMEMWGIRLSAQRDLLMRLQQEADSAARELEQATINGDSDA